MDCVARIRMLIRALRLLVLVLLPRIFSYERVFVAVCACVCVVYSFAHATAKRRKRDVRFRSLE